MILSLFSLIPNQFLFPFVLSLFSFPFVLSLSKDVSRKGAHFDKRSANGSSFRRWAI